MTRKEMEEEKQKILSEMAFLWDRQLGESKAAYRLFCVYRDLGPTRTYKDVAEYCSRNPGVISGYASKFQWKKRAEAYDDHKRRIMQERLRTEILEARIRQQALGELMQDTAKKGIELLKDDLGEIKPADLIRLGEIGAKLEANALGSPTEIIREEKVGEVKHTVEVVDPEIAAELGRLIAIKKSRNEFSEEKIDAE